MLNPGRALALHSESGRPLPRVEAFRDLYDEYKCTPRHGEVIMIAGRSGTQKSGFALFWVAQMNLPTLYFSGDMSAFTASSRLASIVTDQTTEEVEQGMAESHLRQHYFEELGKLNTTFSFGSPITWRGIDEELEAYVHLWNRYPEVIVFDNLMDFEGAESDYTEQMAVMQGATELARETGATVIIMHHASDKSWQAQADPWKPPARNEVKGGLSEKPELSLSVALDPDTLTYRVAVIKQRMGPCDPTANKYAVMWCYPEKTQFKPYDGGPRPA